MRAEIPFDAKRARATLTAAGCSTEGWSVVPAFGEPFPDVCVTFESDERIQVLRTVIANVEDGHVMCETLAQAARYAGERKYSGGRHAGRA
jgi:hypothetical protein